MLLNLVGIVLVATGLAHATLARTAPWALGTGVLALVAWLLWVLLPAGRLRTALLVTGGVCGAASAGLGEGPLVAATIAAVVILLGEAGHSIRRSAGVVVATLTALGAGAVISAMSAPNLLSYAAGIGIGAMLGVTRRQRRVAAQREAAFAAASLEAEREAARTHVLEDRAMIARDIHDLLAHSLGGLVLQLDAIEALLEHGRTAEAAARVGRARSLAGEGLEDARRAVAALRDPLTVALSSTPDRALDDLVRMHRDLGGVIEVAGDLTLAGLDGTRRDAMARAAQEALSNARRHAPGAPVAVAMRVDGRGRTLTISTPLPAEAPPSPGGGHGLVGMRERFAALGDGSTATAHRVDDRFIVTATIAARGDRSLERPR